MVSFVPNHTLSVLTNNVVAKKKEKSTRIHPNSSNKEDQNESESTTLHEVIFSGWFSHVDS